MRKTYFLLSLIFLGMAVFFAFVGTLFLRAESITQEEYAWQAQRLVCDQTAGKD